MKRGILDKEFSIDMVTWKNMENINKWEIEGKEKYHM